MTELIYREYSAQKAVNGSNFSQGNQQFNFSIGNPTSWLPSKSYFRITSQLSAIGRATDGKVQAPAQPLTNDQIAYAEGAMACLYNNVYFQVGGQDVSSIVNYTPQAHMLKMRTMRAGGWLDTIGKSGYMMEPDFQKRVAQIAYDDPRFADSSQGSYIPLDLVTGIHNNVDIAADGKVSDAAAGAVTPLYGNLLAGDSVYIPKLGAVFEVTTAGVSGTLVISYRGTALTNCNLEYGWRAARRDGGQRNIVYGLWQPPLGIFQHPDPMGPGDYRFSLNPNANYQRAAVESTRANGLNTAASPGLNTDNGGLVPASNPDIPTNGDFVLNILDVKLYVATVKVSIPREIYTLDLIEMDINTKPISGNNNTYEFTVPSSTIALAIFTQSGNAGSNTLVPPTRFVQAGIATPLNQQNLVKSLQITYANTTKPPTRWSSDYDNVLVATGSKNELQQRYRDDLQEALLFDNYGGAESFGQWLQRGPYFYYSFNRDREDKSTQVQVALEMASYETGANVFLVAFYSRAVGISVSNGQVQAVQSLIQ